MHNNWLWKGKTKLAHYLVQLVYLYDPNDQQQKWFLERQELVSIATLARAIGFYNIYHQTWAFIEQGKTIMHFGNTTFPYDNEFKEHMKVGRAIS